MTTHDMNDTSHKIAICLVTSHRNDAIGGLETFVSSLSTWLREKNLKTIVVTRKLSLLRPFSLDLCNRSLKPDNNRGIKTVHAGKFIYNTYLLFHSLIETLYLIKLVKNYGVSIVHAQDNFAGLSAVLAKKLCKNLVILHSHGPEFFHRYSFISRALNTPIDKYVTNRVDQIIVTDSITSDYFISFGFPRNKLLIIPTGIDLRAFKEEGNANNNSFEKKTKSQNGFTIGYVGRLSREKNIMKLVEAFAEIVSTSKLNFKLVLVGDGTERLALEKFATTRGVSKSVLFTGWRTDVQELLNIFDVFVLPSLFEGFPIALLEAMAAGKAIIASCIPSIGGIVRHGEEAILVNPYDVEDLKQATLLLYNDPELRANLGRKAKDSAKLYDVDRIYGQILRVYEKLIHSNSK